MSAVTLFLAWRSRRNLARIAQAEEHRRAVIIKQIADRREHHREFKPLYGELRASTHRALAAELGRSDWRRKAVAS